MSREDYRKGFHDGISVDKRNPTTLSIMGYSFEKIIKMIYEKENEMATTLVNRSKLEDKLASIGTPRDINGRYFLLDALEAIGLLHFEPEFTPERKALHAIMTETEVRQGADYGKLTCGYISEYGSGCIISGLEVKGFKIVKI